MKNNILKPIVFSFLMIVFYQNQAFSQTLTKLWESDTTLTTPESVLFEPKENVLYVACINGGPSLENHNSFIAKIGLDGKIIKLKFTEGLNSTKGMGIFGAKLYVTEMTKIVEIDLASGKILNKYEVPNAKFLNDISTDKKGNVYFTDSKDGKVFVLKSGKITLVTEGAPLKGTNGIYYMNEKLVIGNGDGVLYSYDLKTKKLSKLAEGMGGIDGIVQDGNKDFIVSEWRGKVWHVKKDGTIKEMINSVDQKINTADIEYVTGKKLLLIPTFFHNTVAAYTFSE